LLIVYGVPNLAFSVLVGGRPLARWARNPGVAAWEGLRWYALLSLLGLLILVVLVTIYERLDPAAIQLLSKPNPVIQQASGDPAFWILFSFAVGAIEETIFRGWIFGYWITRGTRRWWVHAGWTSALFAGVHLYYGTTYGIAAPLIYPSLFLLGFAFAAVVRASGGNLWVVAVLHGVHDAAAFLTLVSPNAALGVEYGVIGIGAIIAIWDAVASRSTPPAIPPWAPGPPNVPGTSRPTPIPWLYPPPPPDLPPPPPPPPWGPPPSGPPSGSSSRLSPALP
ncbi:MAG: CPBP family intramembrane metalloprotease, partial [Thermoplasmata archaeon]|nr:CPBP family intramembrane metalloprotease [Thermoplasmata archaeon]